jgi:hypothetical protein
MSAGNGSNGMGAPSGAPTRCTNECLAAALEFAALGCRVVIAQGKDPGAFLGRGWQQQATTDERVLRGWWGRWPAGNVGIVGDAVLLPLDVDDPASFERFQAEHGPAPATPRYYTGGAEPPGRERLLLRHPGAALEPKLADGVQLRRGNLMSLVPPSTHPETGVVQEWQIGLDEVPLAQVPSAWLARVVRPNARAARPPSHWSELAAHAPAVGDRHQTLLSLAGHLVARAVHPRVAAELLCGWAAGRCTVAGERTISDQEVAEAVLYCARKEAARRG